MSATTNILDCETGNSMIALYYCYPQKGIPAEKIANHTDFHKDACQSLKLGGRIRVSEEGINGVLSGTKDDLMAYEERLRRELNVLHLEGCVGDVSDDAHECSDPADSRELSDHILNGNKKNDFEKETAESDITSDWLDIKYCHLRTDVPVEKQLFNSLSVKVTREVVSLFDFNSPSISNIHKGDGKSKGMRCRQSRRKKRQQKRLKELHQNASDLGATVAMEREIANSDDKNILRPFMDEKKAYSFTQCKNHFDDPAIDIKNNDKHEKSSSEQNGAIGSAFTIQDWEKYSPAKHLAPEEWNDRLMQLSKKHDVIDSEKCVSQAPSMKIQNEQMKYLEQPSSIGATHQDAEIYKMVNDDDAILLDARNIYETRVGHFAVPNLPTFFPNTRKFSSLPMALNTPEAAEALAGKQVFMYCTGGVRCERAGTYLRALSESNVGAWKGKDKPKGIYQLRGGIQKYLEKYGEPVQKAVNNTSGKNGSNEYSAATVHDAANRATNGGDSSYRCLFRGKNFVFDPRRTDPIIGNGITKSPASQKERTSLVGRCIICSCPHDDYDNGFAPCENKEARCCKCRVLVLVCNDCRQKVRCWGESDDTVIEFKMRLFCGKNGKDCVDEGNISENVETVMF
mmetsp:Transcript_15576/g.33014  ORF Transcript_15576/g.33014 Transcript_15576/m.33014 type:complete len:627 (+) Transcript_15576:42-1922(+)